MDDDNGKLRREVATKQLSQPPRCQQRGGRRKAGGGRDAPAQSMSVLVAWSWCTQQQTRWTHTTSTLGQLWATGVRLSPEPRTQELTQELTQEHRQGLGCLMKYSQSSLVHDNAEAKQRTRNRGPVLGCETRTEPEPVFVAQPRTSQVRTWLPIRDFWITSSKLLDGVQYGT